jgi:hypothetical protein
VEGRSWKGTSSDEVHSCFVLLVNPSCNGLNRNSIHGCNSQHLHTLHGDCGIFSGSSRKPRKLRAGMKFCLYYRHDFDVVRATVAAGGVNQACKLKDLSPHSDVHLCVVDDIGGAVLQYCICRVAGPYQRLEDEGFEAQLKWSTLAGKPTDTERIPRRRQPFRIQTVGAADSIPAAILDFASRVLAPSCPRVLTGILFRLPAQVQVLSQDGYCQEQNSVVNRYGRKPHFTQALLNESVKVEAQLFLEESAEKSVIAVEVSPYHCDVVGEAPYADCCARQIRNRYSTSPSSDKKKGNHSLIGQRIQRFFPSAGVCEGVILMLTSKHLKVIGKNPCVSFS